MYSEFATPEDTLKQAHKTFKKDLVVATGFGPTGIILLHKLYLLKIKVPVFYLETDLLFPETLELKSKLEDKFNIEFIKIHSGLSLEEQEVEYKKELWKSNPDLCCKLRKVNPLHEFLKDKRAWITGLRRDQSKSRERINIISFDSKNNLIKICPFTYWTKDEVWNYILEHDLPYNVLHDFGYSSIGCIPCTKVSVDKEDERSGRWSNFSKTECGIHFP